MESAPTTSPTARPDRIARVPWNPWLGVVFVIVIYYVSQFFGGILVSIYPWAHHMSTTQANDWLTNSIGAQFVYVLLAEAFTIGAIYWFLRLYRQRFSIIGFVKPHWRDLGIGLLGAVAYYAIYLISVPIVSYLFPSFNVSQHQDIGFSSVHGAAQLIMTFISLAILPPLTEEIMVRGFLYSSWRKATPKVVAIIVTSLMFATAHLPEGGAAGPLYVAALDTFILSVVLIFLREKTGSLWAGITVHTIKNSVAFLALFVIGVH